MALLQLVITTATCISSFNNTYLANKISQLSDTSNTILSFGENNLNYENFALTYDQQMNLFDQQILKNAYSNNFISSQTFQNINDSLLNSSYYVNLDNFENGVLSNKNEFNALQTKYNEQLEEISTYLNSDTINLKTVNTISTAAFNFTRDDNTGGGGGDTVETLPLYSCNEDDIYIKINQEVDGCKFIGIECSKNACIKVYNVISKFLNNLAYQKADNVSGIASIIIRALNLIIFEGCASSVEFAGLVTTISTYMKTFLSNILELMKGGTIGFVIAFLIAFVVGAIIGVIIKMVICGALKRGFIRGVKIISLFDYENVDRYLY